MAGSVDDSSSGMVEYLARPPKLWLSFGLGALVIPPGEDPNRVIYQLGIERIGDVTLHLSGIGSNLAAPVFVPGSRPNRPRAG